MMSRGRSILLEPGDPRGRLTQPRESQGGDLTQQWVRRMRDGHRDKRLPVEAFGAVDSGGQSMAGRRKP
jgi:hypothetical protein